MKHLLIILLLISCKAEGQDTTKIKNPFVVTDPRLFGISIKLVPTYPLVIADSSGKFLARRDSIGKWEITDCEKALEVIYRHFKPRYP